MIRVMVGGEAVLTGIVPSHIEQGPADLLRGQMALVHPGMGTGIW